MATLTIRLPDDKHARLKDLAKHRFMSVNKLIEELSTLALAELDNEVRFRALAAQGDSARGLELLDRLDRLDQHFGSTSKPAPPAATARGMGPLSSRGGHP
ncbi:toxin-antitoxin system HicB family antitoxin [Thiohalocapsa halophila]|uniref:toxin-antitoxin system HicB family antitoxin n=1 Tax=Thiohalocapsa halophila TaxID=69359 RepID=UPI001F5B86D1|nr:toxin-antitoxin system HicB family antitoxin [Thiohalocapsa halophila]